MKRYRIFIFCLVLAIPCLCSGQEKKVNSLVVRATDPLVVQQLTPDPIRTRNLFDKALQKFTNTQNTSSAWLKLISPSDVVGIKIYTLSGPLLTSHLDLIEEIINGLSAAGVPKSHIIIFDEYSTSMTEAGYPPEIRKDGVIIEATVPKVGYDPEVQVDEPMTGKLIWGDLEFNDKIPEKEDQLSTKSHFSKILTQKIDKLINVAIPTTHSQLGFWGCELNVTLSMVDNYRRFQRPSFSRDDSITELFQNSVLQKKLVLNILDALVLQYAGGPECDPNFCWPGQTIYLSKDAVALDTLVLKEIDKHRPKADLEPLKEIPYTKSAAEAGAGVANPLEMNIQEVIVSP
jgi:hypothetical protein